MIVSNFDNFPRLSSYADIRTTWPISYDSICRMAMSGCAAKLNKSIKTNIIEILILIMAIPRKVIFLQFGRYLRLGKQCYRQTFGQKFDWLQFNKSQTSNRFQYAGRESAWQACG